MYVARPQQLRNSNAKLGCGLIDTPNIRLEILPRDAINVAMATNSRRGLFVARLLEGFCDVWSVLIDRNPMSPTALKACEGVYV